MRIPAREIIRWVGSIGAGRRTASAQVDMTVLDVPHRQTAKHAPNPNPHRRQRTTSVHCGEYKLMNTD